MKECHFNDAIAKCNELLHALATCSDTISDDILPKIETALPSSKEVVELLPALTAAPYGLDANDATNLFLILEMLACRKTAPEALNGNCRITSNLCQVRLEKGRICCHC